jgi:hypothetical protein
MADGNDSDKLILAGVDLRSLLELARVLSDVPEAGAAVQVSLQSGQLEDFFRLMRERAQAVTRGLEAKAALAVMQPPPAEAAPPRRERELRPESTLAQPAEMKTAPPGGEDRTLAEFISSVTSSIVDAQKSLDERSLAYARELKGTPIAPVHFSIPNVRAEVKMGFNVTDASNVLVKLFGKPEDTTNYGESTVSFEVAASPPPPGSDFASPIPAFLVVDPERGRVIQEAGVPDTQRTSALVLKNAVEQNLSVEGTVYIVLVPHDNAVTMYRVLSSHAVTHLQIGAGDAATALTDITLALKAWIASRTPQQSKQ